MKTEVVISNASGNEVGRIWADTAGTIKADPPGLIALARPFLDASPDLSDARAIVETMRGWSNGYLVAR